MNKISQELRSYLADIGRRGGRKSRRALGPEEARRMVLIREARRAYRDFHAQCFWSSPAHFKPGTGDVDWIAGQLRKYGGAAGWERARKLCHSPESRKKS
jgi:hypothetical protein